MLHNLKKLSKLLSTRSMEKVLFLCVLLIFLVRAMEDYKECDDYLRKYGYVVPGSFNRTQALRRRLYAQNPIFTAKHHPVYRGVKKNLVTITIPSIHICSRFRPNDCNDASWEPSQDLAFQRFVGLPKTGIYDGATKMKMKMKRCGCLDIMYNRTVPGGSADRTKRNARRTQAFNEGRIGWKKTKLTWRLQTPLSGSTITEEKQRDAFRRAFELWANQTTLKFTEINSTKGADINIEFVGRSHYIGPGDEGFDGKGRVLAHAFFPEDGRAHFDEDENWVINSDNGIELFIVAAHEFGHVLGLGHSEVPSALMAPIYSGFKEDLMLDLDDIAGIQTLYGGEMAALAARKRTLRPRQPKPATTSATKSFVCDIPFTAVLSDFCGDLYAFIGYNSFLKIRLGTGVLFGPASSGLVFERPARQPDAAFNIQTTGEFFMVKGLRLFRFDAFWQRNGRPAWILGGTSTMPERPHAALAISRNDIYIFGATQVWKWNAYRDEVIPGSHQYINQTFPGIPNMPDAALAVNSSLAYIFKNTSFYTFDLVKKQVIGGPADIGVYFMKNIC